MSTTPQAATVTGQPSSSVRFDGFSFDPSSGEVRTAPDAPVTVLRPQVAALLTHLCARAGEVVPRDELIAALWQDRHVDAEQGLNQCVRQLRHALGDDAAAPRFVETLPRRGYRLIASPLSEPETGPVADAGTSAAGEPASVPSDVPIEATRGVRRRILAVAAGMFLAALIVGIALRVHGALDSAPSGLRPEAVARLDAPSGPAREPFLAGRYHLRKRLDSPAMRRAAERFREAVLLAPDHGPSWAGLAEASAGIWDLSATERREASHAAARAVALAPRSADSHLQRGRVALWVEHDWDRAEEALRRALAIDPRIPWAREELSLVLMLVGRHDEAAVEVWRAVETDSASSLGLCDAAMILLNTGHYDQALVAADRLEALEMHTLWTLIVRVVANEGLGDWEAARVGAIAHLADLGIASPEMATLAPRAALDHYRRLKLAHYESHRPNNAIIHALVHGGLGNSAEALRHYE
ncbi:MAG: winged helix-turn-helix domain-containing protein, partial [Acidobacteriota bacterium]